MSNLAAQITKPAVLKALNKIISQRPSLSRSTKYNLIYKGQAFPPKEVVRLAAKELGIKDFNSYWLTGGTPTNRHLQKLGFEIIPFKNSDIKNKRFSKENLNKISRLVWNENNWKKPSGRNGKSRAKKSYESKYGYGHEEWLLDFSKLINGFHYGFLEPINKFRSKYIGNVFNILLYTVNSDTKEKFLIGEIKNAKVISHTETIETINEYKKRGWLKEMFKDLDEQRLDSKSLNKWLNETLFNIKFQPDDYYPLPTPFLLEQSKTYIKSSRYILQNRMFEIGDIEGFNGKLILRDTVKKRNLRVLAKRTFEPSEKQVPLLHNRVSMGLEKALADQYKKVICEQATGYGTSIDMVVEYKKELYFYEIKTYDHILTCIRTALGQLIEYSCYPGHKHADRMYIVSQHKANPTIQRYFVHLRKTFRLPLYYMCYSLQEKAIIQEI